MAINKPRKPTPSPIAEPREELATPSPGHRCLSGKLSDPPVISLALCSASQTTQKGLEEPFLLLEQMWKEEEREKKKDRRIDSQPNSSVARIEPRLAARISRPPSSHTLLFHPTDSVPSTRDTPWGSFLILQILHQLRFSRSWETPREIKGEELEHLPVLACCFPCLGSAKGKNS